MSGDMMGYFFEAVKAGVRAFKEGTQPSEYAVAGRPVRCPHCGEGKFAPGSALLNTRGRTAFGVDWADPSATILVCAECGRIEWYANKPDETNGADYFSEPLEAALGQDSRRRIRFREGVGTDHAHLAPP